jgi:hypothetical protein
MQIRNVAGVQVRKRSRREQKTAESGQSKFRASIAGKFLHHQFQAAIEVVVSRAGAGGSEVAQTRRSVEIAVAFLRYRIGCGCQQQITIVGNEQEE